MLSYHVDLEAVAFCIWPPTCQAINLVTVPLRVVLDLVQNELFQIIKVLSAHSAIVLRIVRMILVNMQPQHPRGPEKAE